MVSATILSAVLGILSVYPGAREGGREGAREFLKDSGREGGREGYVRP